MLVLGLQGSPRKQGNTDFLLRAFMQAVEREGARTYIVRVCDKHIIPCRECGICEEKGFCPIQDDMAPEIYPLLRSADVIVMATPIFFYGTPAQLKALIDRCQVLWARRYRLKLHDPADNHRRGYLLALGATKGKNLFKGVELTARYFFDAIGARFDGCLTYRRIENCGDMAMHPTVLQDISGEAARLMSDYRKRMKILFACRENACRSQMAAAFTRWLAGDTVEALSAGSTPASRVNPLMAEVMAEKGLDMAFHIPCALDEVLARERPALLITMGCGEACPFVPGMERIDWDLPDPAGGSIAVMRDVRDEIEQRVKDLIQSLHLSETDQDIDKGEKNG